MTSETREKLPFSAWELEVLSASILEYREKYGEQFDPHARVHMEQIVTRLRFADPA